MPGKRLNTRTRSQQHARDGSVSARSKNAQNVGSTSACPPTAVPKVCSEDLLAAKEAFHLKYSSMPKQTPKRRCTLQEPLTNYQKRMFVDRYIAARKRNADVDYKELSTKTVFGAFRGHPEELKKHGDELLQEFYQIYEQHKAQINQLEPITTSPVAAATEVQPPTGEESQEEHEVATPALHPRRKMNLRTAVALQKVQIAQALLKEAQDTLAPVKD